VCVDGRPTRPGALYTVGTDHPLRLVARVSQIAINIAVMCFRSPAGDLPFFVGEQVSVLAASTPRRRLIRHRASPAATVAATNTIATRHDPSPATPSSRARRVAAGSHRLDETSPAGWVCL
jgi:hypothetical protein